MKYILIALIAVTLGFSPVFADVVKLWRPSYQAAQIVTPSYKNIAVYRFDDDNGATCYISTYENTTYQQFEQSISCIPKVK